MANNWYKGTENVAIIYNTQESEGVLEALSKIQAQQDIGEEDIVVITPNWVNNQKPNPSDGVVVGPNTLRTILRWIKQSRPKRIIVATGSGGGNTEQVMKEVGYDKIIREEQVEFIDFNKGPYVTLELDHRKPAKILVNKIIEEMTYYISFTQLKTHEEATMSGSIKNVALSWPTTEEQGAPKKDLGIHEDLHGFITAMAEKIKINLAIVSANPVMIGTGPTKGIDRHTGLVICGKNPISVDCTCARLLGYMEQGVGYLHNLKNKGYTETDMNKIPMIGLSMVEAEKVFSTKVYGEEMVSDDNVN